MTVVVNLRNPEEEKVLLAFLDSLQYDYQSESETTGLTSAQKQEILERDSAFVAGETTARSWDEIKQELDNVYR